MKFNPSLKLSTYPNSIVIYFVQEASNMLRELENNKLDVNIAPRRACGSPEPNATRYAEGQNPFWYSEFAFNKCATQPLIQKRRQCGGKRKTGGQIRPRTTASLIRIIRGNDGKTCGKNYSYDHDMRALIFERLRDGYTMTVEGFAGSPEGEVPAVDKVRNFFE